ncbi:hypothetical protein ACOSP7_020810 [Xanthoceras sorbifolium]
MKPRHAGGNPKPTGTLSKVKIPPVEETASLQRKSLVTLEVTATVRAVLEQEQRPSGMSRDRRTTGNRKNKLDETTADSAHEYCVMERRNIGINSQGRDLITDIIPKVNNSIGKKTATREERPMQMINQTLNEEVSGVLKLMDHGVGPELLSQMGCQNHGVGPDVSIGNQTFPIGQEGFIKSVDIAGELLNSDASLGPVFHFSSRPKKKQKWKRLVRMTQDGIDPSSVVGLNAKRLHSA